MFRFFFVSLQTKMKKNDVYKQLISGASLLLFASYYLSTALFQHVHIIDGIHVAHSHIHKECHHDTPCGGHSLPKIILIDKLSAFETLTYHGGFSISNVEFFIRNLQSDVVCKPQTEFVSFFFLRGPPVV
jgi:hypothetical protein